MSTHAPRVLEVKLSKHGACLSHIPLASAIDYLQQRQNHSVENRGEYKALIMRINQSSKRSDADIIPIIASGTDRIETLHLKQMTCFFIAQKTGHLYCPSCNKLVEGKQVIFERYIRESTTGKRFYCKAEKHLMLDLIDLRKAGESNKLLEEFALMLQEKSLEEII